jgi:hypothetical protein
LDPDSVRAVDLDLESGSGSGSRRANKYAQQKFKEISCCAGCSFLRAEGFFCSLDVLFGGLGIGKRQFLIQKIFNFFSYNF